MINKDINCFVIMPFSRSSEKHTEAYWTNHFNEFLKPMIEEISDIKVFRVEALREDILDTIINNLVVADIVVADITDHNPNVFWELGVRQSFKHNTIIIAETGTKLPFDLSIKAIIFYDLINEEKIAEFRVKFKDAILDCINNPHKSDSHVLERLSGRGSLYEVMRLDETRRRVEALIIEAKMNLQNYENLSEIGSKMTKDSYINHEIRFSLWWATSVEFLVSNRYLDEDMKFYNTANYVLGVLKTFKQFSAWFNTMNEDEKELYLNYYNKNLRLGKGFKRIFILWIDLLERVYKKINERIHYQITTFPVKDIKDIKPQKYEPFKKW